MQLKSTGVIRKLALPNHQVSENKQTIGFVRRKKIIRPEPPHATHHLQPTTHNPFHVPPSPSVILFVSALRLLLCLLPVSLAAQTLDLGPVLKAVEARYNHAQTLQVVFHEAYTGPGQPRRTESGTLLLRKPGRMRWDYTSPQGKLFVSDGKYLWLYTPSNNKVEQMKIKESDDMRAPLAFLLGKLHFDKEFRNIKSAPAAAGIRITADPKTDTLPYTSVEFVVGKDNIIRHVQVVGYDKSILEFDFDQEKLNPPLEAKLFQFRMPPGAALVETAQ
ncbi:MAG: LolA family protein [Bryobacteraceae bacterium]